MMPASPCGPLDTTAGGWRDGVCQEAAPLRLRRLSSKAIDPCRVQTEPRARSLPRPGPAAPAPGQLQASPSPASAGRAALARPDPDPALRPRHRQPIGGVLVAGMAGRSSSSSPALAQLHRQRHGGVTIASISRPAARADCPAFRQQFRPPPAASQSQRGPGPAARPDPRACPAVRPMPGGVPSPASPGRAAGPGPRARPAARPADIATAARARARPDPHTRPADRPAAGRIPVAGVGRARGWSRSPRSTSSTRPPHRAYSSPASARAPQAARPDPVPRAGPAARVGCISGVQSPACGQGARLSSGPRARPAARPAAGGVLVAGVGPGARLVQVPAVSQQPGRAWRRAHRRRRPGRAGAARPDPGPGGRQQRGQLHGGGPSPASPGPQPVHVAAPARPRRPCRPVRARAAYGPQPGPSSRAGPAARPAASRIRRRRRPGAQLVQVPAVGQQPGQLHHGVPVASVGPARAARPGPRGRPADRPAHGGVPHHAASPARRYGRRHSGTAGRPSALSAGGRRRRVAEVAGSGVQVLAAPGRAALPAGVLEQVVRHGVPVTWPCAAPAAGPARRRARAGLAVALARACSNRFFARRLGLLGAGAIARRGRRSRSAGSGARPPSRATSSAAGVAPVRVRRPGVRPPGDQLRRGRQGLGQSVPGRPQRDRQPPVAGCGRAARSCSAGLNSGSMRMTAARSSTSRSRARGSGSPGAGTAV